MRVAEADRHVTRWGADGRQRSTAASPTPDGPARPADAGRARSPGPVTLAQIGCTLAGILGLCVAATVDLDFVRMHLAADGVVTASQAAALPAARLALAALGAALLLLAALLPRLARMPRLAGVLESRRLEWSIFLTPPVLLIALAGYKLARGTEDPLYLLAVREDSVVESLTALAYFAVFVVAFVLVGKLRLARRYPLAIFYALIGVCGLFVALEEISYGQRLMGFGTPEAVAAHNVQREMTLHNLDFVHQVVFTLAPVAVGVFGVLGVVLAAARRSIDRRAAWLLSFLVPPWFLASWFVPVALFALYATFFWGEVALIEWQDQEPLEALLAFGFLAFLLSSLARLRDGRTGSIELD